MTRTLRIRGLVSIQNRIRQLLLDGIPPESVTAVRRDIEEAVGFVRDACRAHGVSPAALPGPSRRAWEFLRSVDLETLPVRAAEEDRSARGDRRGGGGGLQISGIVGGLTRVSGRLSRLAESDGVDAGALEDVRANAAQLAGEVESILRREGAQAGELPVRSRRAFALLGWLADPENCRAALASLAVVHRAAREASEGRIPLDVQFVGGDTFFRRRGRSDQIEAQLNVGFVGAPDDILVGFGRLFAIGRAARDRLAWETYRATDAYRGIHAELELLVGEGARHQPRGRAHDLDELFEGVNRQRFGGAMARPTMDWSRVPSRRLLGKYLDTVDHVQISSALDDERVSEDLVAFVLFHELLHRKHPARVDGGRLLIHPPEFQAEERSHPRFAEMERRLRDFARRGPAATAAAGGRRRGF